MNQQRLTRRARDAAELRDTLHTLAPPPDEAVARVLPAARHDLETRRRRRRVFGDDADLLGDPVWEGLLTLFVAEADGRPVSMGSLALAMHLAPTTGLRWITLLEERGFVAKRRDGHDARRWFVDLLAPGRALVLATLEPVRGAG